MPVTGDVYKKYKRITSNGVVVRRFFHSLIDFSLEPGAPSPLQYTMYNNGTEDKSRVYTPFMRNQGHILPARYVIEFFTDQNPDETKIVKKVRSFINVRKVKTHIVAQRHCTLRSSHNAKGEEIPVQAVRIGNVRLWSWFIEVC